MRQAYSTSKPASSALDGVPPAACRVLAAELFTGAQAIHGRAREARDDYGLRLRLLRSSGALAGMRLHVGARLQVADPDSEDARDLRHALYDLCDAHSLVARVNAEALTPEHHQADALVQGSGLDVAAAARTSACPGQPS